MGVRGGGGLQGRFELAFVMPSHGYLVRGDMGWVGRGGWPGGWGWGGATEMTHKLPCQERYGVAGKRGGGGGAVLI